MQAWLHLPLLDFFLTQIVLLLYSLRVDPDNSGVAFWAGVRMQSVIDFRNLLPQRGQAYGRNLKRQNNLGFFTEICG